MPDCLRRFLESGFPEEAQNGFDAKYLKQLVLSKSMFFGPCFRAEVNFSKSDLFRPVPCTLLPTAFNRKVFERMRDSQPTFLRLVDLTACDHQFLRSELASFNRDEFVTGFLQIMDQVYGPSNPSPKNFGNALRGYIVRNDFMEHVDPAGKRSCKQVEVNTISIAGLFIGEGIAKTHQSNMKILSSLTGGSGDPNFDFETVVPLSRGPEGLQKILSELHASYLSRFFGTNVKPRPIGILVLKTETEANLLDIDGAGNFFEAYTGVPVVQITEERALQLWKDGKLKIELSENVDSTEDGHTLFIHKSIHPMMALCSSTAQDGWLEISIVYFRCQYSPSSFKHEGMWALRRAIEGSRACSIPSVPASLAGMKKIQQAWSIPGALERFLGVSSADDAVSVVRETFIDMVDLHAVSGDSEKEVVFEAETHPDRFLLKPCREGGGNNITDSEEISQILKARNEKGSSGVEDLILMRRICPPKRFGALLGGPPPDRNVAQWSDWKLQYSATQVIPEIGFFCLGVWNGQNEVSNFTPGVLVRTKAVGVQEGGLVAGYACADAPLLVDN